MVKRRSWCSVVFLVLVVLTCATFNPPVVVAQGPTKFPAYSKELSGLNINEVRIKNPNSFDVQVALRSEDKGKDFFVSANGTTAVRVPNGHYDIFFIYSDRPGAVYQGDGFTLHNNGVEIQIVKVVGGNYGIRRVK